METKFLPLFLRLLKGRMAKRGVSARGLAARTGMSSTYAIKMMAGERNPPSDRFIRKIANALEVDYERLLLYAGRIPIAFRGGGILTSRDLETILAFMRRMRKARKRARKGGR